MISILDYGVGNLASVRNALAFLGIANETISSPAQVAACSSLILPGVGAFAPAMLALEGSGLAGAVATHAKERQRPVLGICLGMQLLLDESLELGNHAGLGLIKGSVRPLSDVVAGLVVPHVGWNDVFPTSSSRLAGDSPGVHAFYFVHSYYCDVDDRAQVTGTTTYGIEFPSMLERDNVFGCQFHPEKSQRHGLAILKRFSEL